MRLRRLLQLTADIPVRRALATIGAVLCGAALVAWPPPAAAEGGTGGINPSLLMDTGDIPRVLGRFSPAGVSEPVEPNITLCQDARNLVVSIPAPERLTTVVASSVPRSRLYRSVSEDVFQFPNAAAASSAFADLGRAASSCTGTTSQRDAEGGTTQQVRLSTGAVAGQAARGALWTKQQTRYPEAPAGSALDGHRDILYRVFAASGNAIVVTTYFVNGSAAIAGRQAAAAQRLAVANAERWIAR